MTRPKLLDLYCCEGGAAFGYMQAGFDVTGIDINPQPRYIGDAFVQADALEYVAAHGHEYDVIHASPPCQRYSSMTPTAGTSDQHPDLIAATRAALIATGKPYIIENVAGARRHLRNPLMLCGTMFGLNTVRHRYFETEPVIYFAPAPCCHLKPVVKAGRKPDRARHYASAVGHMSDVEWTGQSLGIDWMSQGGLAECIPPAYTEWLGRKMLEALEVSA